VAAGGGVVFETGKLDRIIARFSERAQQQIAGEALEIEALATANTVRVETGTMRPGWVARRITDLLWRVSNPVFYAVFHEFGTSRLAASPMLGPAVEVVRAKRRGRVRGLFRP
jgi:hypothetical protein